MRQVMVDDRFNGVHHLLPVIEADPDGFLTSGDNLRLQSQWAAEQGMKSNTPLDEILLAQIEHHRAEIFYNLDPVRYGNTFLKRLPGCVRKSIAWRAAPSGNAQFLDHDLVVNNYPTLAAQYRAQGAKTAYFFPGHDPAMDAFAANEGRPIDILFIGGYTRHHQERAAALDAVSQLADRYNVVFNLDISRATKLAETAFGLVGPLRKLRRPVAIRQVSAPPVFGTGMYRQISRSKIVINGKVDISGPDRGNMRLWETLGCNAALVTDAGNYPRGMAPGSDFAVYDSIRSLLDVIDQLLGDESKRKAVARAGYDMISSKFSKAAQWRAFQELC
jgi:Glycosyl transferases group 1